YSYLSLGVVERVLSSVGLRVFDVEELPTHGGSLRVYACRLDAKHPSMPGLEAVRALERKASLDRPDGYRGFAGAVTRVKTSFLAFLAEARAAGKTVAAYGAAAKGNTFMNTIGVTAADIACVADRNPVKQGKLMPGSHVPIVAPEALDALRPDYIVILPWNLEAEFRSQLAHSRKWGGRFVLAVPETRIIEA